MTKYPRLTELGRLESHLNLVAARCLGCTAMTTNDELRGQECPDCGCRAQEHNAVNRVPAGLIAHCGGCGACWKSLNTAFTRALRLRWGA